jgi:hypothetical protein
LRSLRREIKMSKEGKGKRKVCVWKRKREKWKVKKKYVYERMKKSYWKIKKERTWVPRKIWEGWIKWKKNKVQGRMSRCWETKLSLFFQPCAIRQRGRHRCLIVIFSFFSWTCPPLYIFSSLISPHMY